jgi:putative tryptophan/tyrosine transport system substrate-binding protein
MGTAEEDPQNQPYLAGFKRALQELGWIEGRNIHVDYRFGASDVERMQRFAMDLVNAQPDLIVGHTTPGTAALARETKTIPMFTAPKISRLSSEASASRRAVASR